MGMGMMVMMVCSIGAELVQNWCPTDWWVPHQYTAPQLRSATLRSGGAISNGVYGLKV